MSFTSLYQPEQLQGSGHSDSTYLPLKDFLTLKNLSLSIQQGSFVCVIGEVGSGKTSLINCLTNNMLYTQHSFYQQYCTETIDEIKDELIQNSKKVLAPNRSPVVLSESTTGERLGARTFLEFWISSSLISSMVSVQYCW